MANVETATGQKSPSWTQKQVYTLSAICIVVGLAFGYLLRGTEGTGATSVPTANVVTPDAGTTPQAASGPQSTTSQPMPSLEDMKRMADKKAEPLLAQLKNDPKDPKLLVQIGNVYKSAHQFADAAKYFGQALEQSPKDPVLRDEVGGALYYAGDTDAAIATFEEGLKYTPNDASTLFNLGVMKLQKKGDVRGAIELWQRLLKTNPNLPANKKDQVEKMIAEAKKKAPLVVN